MTLNCGVKNELDTSLAAPPPQPVDNSIAGYCVSGNQTECVSSASFPTQSTPATPATVENVLEGTEFYVGGALQIGTMSDNATWNLSDSFAAAGGAGYYSGVSNLPAASDYCSTTTLFGVAGSANCVSAVSLMASNAWRDAGAAPLSYFAGVTTSNQLTQSAEATIYGQASGGQLLPQGGGYNYRDIPDSTKDDDGISGTSVSYALRPQVACGSSGTIAARIADCATQNPSASTWDGALKGNAGQALWKLVFTTGQQVPGECNGGASLGEIDCREVWQDTRTGLLWSSIANDGIGANWCQASGNIDFAPVALSQAYNMEEGTPIIGNGTISAIAGGSSSDSETITVTMTGATTFNVSGSNCGGGSISAGALSETAGSSVTFSRSNYCSFTLTQGSIPFSNNDIFIIKSTGAGGASCVPGAGSGLQPLEKISYCAEQPGYYPGFEGDDYGGGAWAGGSYTYDTAKGGMGRTSVNPVYWRLPTKYDYQQADNDGIRFVMPDMGNSSDSRPVPDGTPGGRREQWTATVDSTTRSNSWFFSADGGVFLDEGRTNASFYVRCVGR